LEQLENNRPCNGATRRKVTIEDVKVPRDAVVESMDTVTQLEGIDFTTAPLNEIALELRKLC